ncbi:unnamed protein product [Ostreobium quekettii]|uniref:Protein kinase domain-containing protein n=1 Tax=Ostreobium quekettii TaxID=121088 RepID=A0A8S1IXK0_9CHLO|nr:unnamed protein product [Ostreobium quekettii]
MTWRGKDQAVVGIGLQETTVSEERRLSVGGSEVQYNNNIMRFLKHQLDKVQHLQRPPAASLEDCAEFDVQVAKGRRLLSKHTEFPDIRFFYTTKVACMAVERICSCLKDILEDWHMQHAVRIEDRIPYTEVVEDEHSLHNLLSYILRGRVNVMTEQRRAQWEAIRSDHYRRMGELMIDESELFLNERIAGGSMADVHRAEWRSAKVVVKKSAKGAELSVEILAELMREAYVHSSLNHPNIVHLHGLTASGWMVMEQANTSLWHWCHSRRELSWDITLRLLQQAADGLDYMHRHQPVLVHSDVKPSNFLIFGTQPDKLSLKISDFGVSFEERGTRRNTVRLGGGTPEYIAPEVSLDKPLTQSSDVFSFGVTMFEVVSRQRPYGGRVGNLHALFMRKNREELPCHLTVRDCPREMVELMRRCCAPEPSNRPTMEEVSHQLLQMPLNWAPVELPESASGGVSEWASKKLPENASEERIPVQEPKMEVQYNNNIIRFLKHQLDKVRNLHKPPNASPEDCAKLDFQVASAHMLITKHAKLLDVQHLYTSRVACDEVESMCRDLKNILEGWHMQGKVGIQDRIPNAEVMEDEQCLHNLLNFILRGRDCDVTEQQRAQWTDIRRDYDCWKGTLKIISESEVQLLEEIGAGGMGVVRKAEWLSTKVAVKKIEQGFELPVEKLVELIREGRVQSSLMHPNIVRLHGITASGWMVMELADTNLWNLCHSRQELPWSAILTLLVQSAKALDYLHCHKPVLVHSNVKPQNFLIFGTHPGTLLLKVSDIGVSFQERGTRGNAIRFGCGTPEYNAPETFLDLPLTQASDVFSFGVVMFEVVSGKRPYGGRTGNLASLYHKKSCGEPPCPVGHQDCPPEMVQLMKWCCAADPSGRPTMAEVIRQLQQLSPDWVPADEPTTEGTITRERRREVIESGSGSIGRSQQLEQDAAAVPKEEEEEMARGNAPEEQATASPIEEDAEDRHSRISIIEVQQQLMGLRYNSNILQFLKDQMENARGLALLDSLSEKASQQLDIALKQGDRLIRKHSDLFDVKRFYKIEDAAEAVLQVCGRMRDALVAHKSQIAYAVPQDCIDKDRRHLYAHLGYVLMGKHLGQEFENEVHFWDEWQSLRRWHEVQMRDLNVIVDSDVSVGQGTGQGGYGEVFAGQWRHVKVAVKKVKLVDARVELPMENFAEVFKEASTLASLNHPHIVRLYGITKSGWMIMELADGDLSTLWADTKLTWTTILDVLEQAAAGLEYVHRKQPPLVHGDIKDKNFLYIKNGDGKYVVKLADFGLTTEVRNWQTDTMRKPAVTPVWMAPELYAGEKPSLKSDVFSFGLVMYSVVTGCVPYGFGTNDLVIMSKKLSSELPCSVTECGAPSQLIDLMKRCVSLDPRNRPGMGEVADCLAKLAEK